MSMVTILAAIVMGTTAIGDDSSMVGDIFAADYFGGKVHHYDGASLEYEGVFCTRTTGFVGLTFSPDGDLVIASSIEDKILRYDTQTGSFEGVVFDTQIDNPRGVAFGPDGTLWVSALKSHALVGINPDTGEERYRATVSRPMAVAAGNGRIYVTSQTGGTVHQFDAMTGEPLGVLASGLGTNPQAIAVCPDGSLLVSSSDESNPGIHHIDQHDGRSLGFLEKFGHEGIAVWADGMAYSKSLDGALCRIDPEDMTVQSRLIAGFLGTHGIAMYPIPEPSGVVLLVIGAASLLLAARRRESPSDA